MKLDKDGVVEVKHVENGFIVKWDYWESTTDKGEKIIQEEVHVIEDDEDTENSEKICYKRMLEKVAELLGCTYDRWSSDNLNITFDKKGGKVD